MEADLKLNELGNILRGKTIEDFIETLVSLWPGEIVFTTSFGFEDQVLTHKVFKNNIPVEVVTLDTGRLFPETYKVFSETIKRYNKKINMFFPDHDDVEKMVSDKGPFSFYDSKENRLECCRIRKVIPLDRVLKGKKCWISGIRAEQSENRGKMAELEYDEDRKLFKYYPLFLWSFEEVEKFIRENNVPYNKLHDKGYVSIGCEPCTRAIIKGQDFRAGRWWWENDGPKECGCHLKSKVES
ncbi:MAG: phosphoadenylyl-sulfate reductase [Bacteroidia bacterium]|nr:phosphoadenylyl-sulfate reductase [Bacteroidia bacterium]